MKSFYDRGSGYRRMTHLLVALAMLLSIIGISGTQSATALSEQGVLHAKAPVNPEFLEYMRNMNNGLNQPGDAKAEPWIEWAGNGKTDSGTDEVGNSKTDPGIDEVGNSKTTLVPGTDGMVDGKGKRLGYISAELRTCQYFFWNGTAPFDFHRIDQQLRKQQDNACCE